MQEIEAAVVSRRQAAEALGISIGMIDTLLAQGKLRARHMGRRVLISRAELENLLRRDTLVARKAGLPKCKRGAERCNQKS